jgi:hypothetical protein
MFTFPQCCFCGFVCRADCVPVHLLTMIGRTPDSAVKNVTSPARDDPNLDTERRGVLVMAAVVWSAEVRRPERFPRRALFFPRLPRLLCQGRSPGMQSTWSKPCTQKSFWTGAPCVFVFRKRARNAVWPAGLADRTRRRAAWQVDPRRTPFFLLERPPVLLRAVLTFFFSLLVFRRTASCERMCTKWGRRLGAACRSR